MAVGAHPDDIEIGAGGTLLTLAESSPGMRGRYVVLTGTEERHSEARNAATAFLPDADITIDLHQLPEVGFPQDGTHEGGPGGSSPNVGTRSRRAVVPRCASRPSNHRRGVADRFRDQLVWSYEIPKWDGDLGRPSIYVPLTRDVAHRKVELLHKCFPSQAGREWWDDEVFLGLARLRGMECRAQYCEAFTCTKSVVQPLVRSYDDIEQQGVVVARSEGEACSDNDRLRGPRLPSVETASEHPPG